MLGENSTRRYHRRMNIYLVGGAVRDELLGLHVRERDWVVVGATPEQMAALGYRPVGKDFPVFLHPETREEYALARTERKTAPGYKGFVVHAEPTVTLEQDLRRRDLTINALARAADGTLIDPYGGADDLRAGLLRHVSPAFAEDPVRLLRVARFAARFARYGFHVAHGTHTLMRQMVESGEADHLVPERVFAELDKALAEPTPARFFEVLCACGALARVMPELAALCERPPGHGDTVPQPAALRRLDLCAAQNTEARTRFAALLQDSEPGAIEALCDRIKAPNDYRELALLAARYCDAVQTAPGLSPEALLALIEALDLLRRPARLAPLLAVCEAAARVRGVAEDLARQPAGTLTAACATVAGVDAAVLVAEGFSGPALGAALRRARLVALGKSIG
jgi:tRNA nucleotidyltransferase (CCA-adding enzyme)